MTAKKLTTEEPVVENVDAIAAINERIMTVVKKFRLSQKDFAAKIGCSAGHIVNIKKGKAPSQMMVNSICCHYHIRREWLMTGEGEMMQGLTSHELSATLQRIVGELNKLQEADQLRVLADVMEKSATK